MANTSIVAAFERMWQHVVTLVNGKASVNHGHKLSELENDSSFATTEYVDTKATCLTVNVTKSGTTFSADTTFSVISAAIDNNTTVYVKYNNTIYYPALKTAALIMFRSHGSSSEDIINIMSSGVVTATYSSLPVATEDSLGGIKSGGDISVSTDGIVTVNPSVVQEAYNLADAANTAATSALTAASGAQTTADAAMPKAGGTMTGALTLAGDPTADLHAATKQYVDANASNVFVAEYGVTTLEELNTANDAGKQLICKYTPEGSTQIWYGLGWCTGTNSFRFMFVHHVTGYVQVGINAAGMWTKYIDSKLTTMTSDKVLTSEVVAQSNTNYTTKQVRNIILVADGEEIPAGANGDICLVYAP